MRYYLLIFSTDTLNIKGVKVGKLEFPAAQRSHKAIFDCELAITGDIGSEESYQEQEFEAKVTLEVSHKHSFYSVQRKVGSMLETHLERTNFKRYPCKMTFNNTNFLGLDRSKVAALPSNVCTLYKFFSKRSMLFK